MTNPQHIPTHTEIQALWQKYGLPDQKRIHVTLVAQTAVCLAGLLRDRHGISVDAGLLQAAALLHDIDKSVKKLPGERHPDAAVRILKTEGFPEIAAVVRTHPLHSILDPSIRPESWEEKLLYLSDKMVKYDILTVDKRFDLWRAEDLPEDARNELEAAYPKVKDLEKTVFGMLDISPEEMADYAGRSIL